MFKQKSDSIKTRRPAILRLMLLSTLVLTLLGVPGAWAAGSWQTVGTAGFSAGGVAEISIALDSSDIPYVTYGDEGNSGKATVKKFDSVSGSWQTVGSAGFSAGRAEYPSIALDSSGTPYVAYQDFGNSDKATVMKFAADTAAITLASFNVEANDGRAMVMWETGTEIDNAGFNLYRAVSPDGPWVKVNQSLIAAEGDPVSGAAYSFVDRPGRGVFYYQLEDMDLSGVTTLHTPVMAQLGPMVRTPWFKPVLPDF